MIGTIINILKGGWNARKPENSVPGGDGCEHRIIYPFEAICEQAISDIGRVRMLAAECAAERSGDSGAVSSDPIRREGLALIAAARRTGDFVQVTDVPGTRYTIRTGESEVRIVQTEQVYYKIKDPFAKMHLKRHPVECILLEHVVHNILFPDCRLEFVGVTEDFHKARLVLRQKAVRSESRPDDGQIARALGSLGLKPERRYEFGNEFVFKRRTGLNERFSNEVEIVGQGRHWTKSILLPVRLAACEQQCSRSTVLYKKKFSIHCPPPPSTSS